MIAVPLNGREVRQLENQTTGDKLHVIAARGMVFSCWRFSPEEMAMAQLGKPVWVIMKGSLIPEFILSVGERNQVVPPEIIRRAQRNDDILSTKLGQEVTAAHRRKAWMAEALAYIYLVLIMGAVAAALTGLGYLFLRWFPQ